MKKKNLGFSKCEFPTIKKRKNIKEKKEDINFPRASSIPWEAVRHWTIASSGFEDRHVRPSPFNNLKSALFKISQNVRILTLSNFYSLEEMQFLGELKQFPILQSLKLEMTDFWSFL